MRSFLPCPLLQKTFAIGMGLSALLLNSLVWAQEQPPSPVVVAPVVQQDVSSGHTFVGSVTPTRVAVIGSAVDGRVIEFLVNEGDRVEKDQPLAQLLTNTLEFQLGAEKAELDMRREVLAELENGTRAEELEQSEGRLQEMQALNEYAKAKLERAKRLMKTRSGTEDELEDALSLSLQAEQRLRQAKAAHDMAVNGPRKERIAQAQAAVRVQEDTVRGTESRLEKHTIRSRFAGYVTAEHTETGQWVSAGELVAEVMELDHVDIRVSVLENYIDQIKVGDQARVEVGAVPEESFVGTVVHVVPHADQRSRSFPVKVRVENRPHNGSVILKSGMFARVTLGVGTKEKALMIPKDALVLGGPSPMVYVVERDKAKTDGPQASLTGVVRPVPVELGVSFEGRIQVKGPLQPGQEVVTRGNERLFPGKKIIITESSQAELSQSTKQ